MKSEDDRSARCPNPYALTIPTQSLLRIRISASEAVCGIKVIVKVLTRHADRRPSRATVAKAAIPWHRWPCPSTACIANVACIPRDIARRGACKMKLLRPTGERNAPREAKYLYRLPYIHRNSHRRRTFECARAPHTCSTHVLHTRAPHTCSTHVLHTDVLYISVICSTARADTTGIRCSREMRGLRAAASSGPCGTPPHHHAYE